MNYIVVCTFYKVCKVHLLRFLILDITHYSKEHPEEEVFEAIVVMIFLTFNFPENSTWNSFSFLCVLQNCRFLMNAMVSLALPVSHESPDFLNPVPFCVRHGIH